MILENISEAKEKDLQKGTFLILLNATKIPPHILLAHNGFYYSLSVKGVDKHQDLKILFAHINKKKSKTIFIQLNTSASNTLIEAELEKSFSSYKSLNLGNSTCLAPIKDFCAAVFALNISGVDFVFQLIAELKHQKKIGFITHFHLENELVNSTFALPVYSFKEINEEIERAGNSMIDK